MNDLRFKAMGTDVHLVVIGMDRAQAAAALAEGRALIEDAEQRLSRFRDDSELSQLNRSQGKPTIVSSRTMEVLVAAKQAWVETDGAFDPTLGAELCELGYRDDFGTVGSTGSAPAIDLPESPPASRTSRAGEIVLHPVSNLVTIPEGIQLDLGGIAKGATADRVAQHLMTLDAEGCCVNVGGDLRICGVGPDDGAWNIGLPCPGSDETRVVRIAEGAVATSSTAKRKWPTTRGPVHHLLDPDTGKSRSNGPVTVTAVAATASAAEVVSKWMMAGNSPDHFDATGLRVEADGQITHEAGLDMFLVGSSA